MALLSGLLRLIEPWIGFLAVGLAAEHIMDVMLPVNYEEAVAKRARST